LTEARDWIMDCDHIFREMGYEDHLKRRMAAWHLRKEAFYWWTPVRGENEKEMIIWADFKNHFKARFMSTIEVSI